MAFEVGQEVAIERGGKLLLRSRYAPAVVVHVTPSGQVQVRSHSSGLGIWFNEDGYRTDVSPRRDRIIEMTDDIRIAIRRQEALARLYEVKWEDQPLEILERVLELLE